MIVDEKLLVEYLAKWLADYAYRAGRATFVVANRGTREDWVVDQLCHEATKVIGGLKTNIRMVIDSERTDAEILMSCHEYADDHNGIVVGSIERTFGLYWRGYQKMGDALADIFPLYDISYSEIIQLYDSMDLDEFDGIYPIPGAAGYGMYPIPGADSHKSHKMVEFCNNAEALYGIITREDPPHTHKRWPYFTQEQKKWIALTHQREKKTRHKVLTKPYPVVSDKPQLCRRNVQ
jgi:hypothetical protein